MWVLGGRLQSFVEAARPNLWVCLLLSKEVAILCSFLLGLGDSCFNTQLLSILGFLYSEDSAPAFAVFKFVQVTLNRSAPVPALVGHSSPGFK